jgi:ABC-type lipoprotein export system ATPase subunit
MIEIQNLTKVIGSKEVLRDLNLSIGLGDFVSIIGPSGSGKTTLLNIILLIGTKTSGSYCYNSEDIDDILSNNVKLKKFRNDFGVMSAFSELIPNLNVRENIILPAVINNIEDVEDNYRSLLKKLQIENLQNDYVFSLSSGEKQRVLLARALILDPPILVADEPTSNLDENNAVRMIEILSNLNEQNKTTIIIATHDDKIYKRTNAIMRIEDGRISV